MPLQQGFPQYEKKHVKGEGQEADRRETAEGDLSLLATSCGDWCLTAEDFAGVPEASERSTSSFISSV